MNEYMQAKLLMDLQEEGIDDASIAYIRESVNYLDTKTESSMRIIRGVPEKVKSRYMYAYLNVVLEIVKKIKNHTTGVYEIDTHNPLPYEDDYVSIIAKNGGMYGYVLKSYEDEFKQKNVNTPRIY